MGPCCARHRRSCARGVPQLATSAGLIIQGAWDDVCVCVWGGVACCKSFSDKKQHSNLVMNSFS